MGIFSRFEDRMEDTVEGAASRMSKAPISPVQIAKKAERQMRRETMVGAGKEYAPTLYTVLVNPDDDARLFGYYPTLAGETETYLKAKASQEGLVMDGNPLVRFIVDEGLRHGKFDIIAETVAAPIIAQLRQEEMERYGLAQQQMSGRQAGNRGPRSEYAYEAQQDDRHQPQGQGYAQAGLPADAPRAAQQREPLPYVPEDEIDRSINYGEYTFDSRDFQDYNDPEGYDPYGAPAPRPAAGTPAPAQHQPSQAPQPQQRAASRAPQAFLVELDTNRKHNLNDTIFTMGRDSGCDIPIKDINASRKHAELRLNKQGLWVITDLNSTNGTLVNGVAIASQPLYPGDVITIGKTDLEFALA